MNYKSILKWGSATLWVALGFATLNVIPEFVSQGQKPGSLIAEVLVWLFWLAIFAGLLVPTTLTLTTTRIFGPAYLILLTSITFTYGTDATKLIVCILCAFSVIIFSSAKFGDIMINGSAYGSERRIALKTPTMLLFTWLFFAWIICCILISFAIWKLNENQLLGYIASVSSVVVSYIAYKVLHQFSKRWLVFVPAGFVIHDHFLLKNSVLFRRNQLEYLTTSSKETVDIETLDLTGGTTGLTSSLRTKEKVIVDVKNSSEPEEIESVTFAPSLPGEVLREARARGIKTQL